MGVGECGWVGVGVCGWVWVGVFVFKKKVNVLYHKVKSVVVLAMLLGFKNHPQINNFFYFLIDLHCKCGVWCLLRRFCRPQIPMGNYV